MLRPREFGTRKLKRAVFGVTAIRYIPECLKLKKGYKITAFRRKIPIRQIRLHCLIKRAHSGIFEARIRRRFVKITQHLIISRRIHGLGITAGRRRRWRASQIHRDGTELAAYVIRQNDCVFIRIIPRIITAGSRQREFVIVVSAARYGTSGNNRRHISVLRRAPRDMFVRILPQSVSVALPGYRIHLRPR